MRYFEFEGKCYPHVIDPSTGMPVQNVASVTVVHPQAAVADAVATALMVACPERGFEIVQRMGLTGVMLVDQQGKVHMNPAMVERIKFEGVAPRRVIVAEFPDLDRVSTGK